MRGEKSDVLAAFRRLSFEHVNWLLENVADDGVGGSRDHRLQCVAFDDRHRTNTARSAANVDTSNSTRVTASHTARDAPCRSTSNSTHDTASHATSKPTRRHNVGFLRQRVPGL